MENYYQNHLYYNEHKERPRSIFRDKNIIENIFMPFPSNNNKNIDNINSGNIYINNNYRYNNVINKFYAKI